MSIINRLGSVDDSKATSYPSLASFPSPSGSGRFAWDETAKKLYVDDPATTTWIETSASGSEATTVSDTNSIDLTLIGTDISADLKLSAAAATAGFLKASTTVELDGLKTEIPNKLFKIETFTLNGTDITNKYVILSEAPAVKTATQLTIINGLAQDNTIDFEITTDDADKRLSWNALGLDGILEIGDKIIVYYN